MRRCRSSTTECVVCGRPLDSGHRCPKSVLAAREAAERHAENIDDPGHPAIPACLDDRRRSFGQRLAEGFGESW